MWQRLKRFFIQSTYVSPIDEYLQNFDRNHPLPSASQRKEQEKYRHIYDLRDVSDREDSSVRHSS